MFLKPFRVKSKSTIKGSDRKKLRTEIGNQYHIDDDILSSIVPNKQEMTVMKLSTHSASVITVYNIGGDPAFFEYNRILYPTVYTLWKHPDILPAFTTWPPVFKKLQNGADLMLPGVIVKGDVTPSYMGGLPKGTPCSIKLLGNRAPVVLGKTALSTEDMYGCAMKGKGVNVIHCFGDQLWALGSKIEPPQIDDVEMLAVVQNTTDKWDDDESESDAGDNNEEITDASLKIADGMKSVALADPDGAKGGEEEAGKRNTDEEQEEDPHIAQERMDELLTLCFMCALKNRVKKSDLPLLTSSFFRNHLQPCCPAGQTVDVKKSSYKKLTKFLKAMQDRGYVKVKELQKGVESIIEIHKEHPDIHEFTVGLHCNDAAVLQPETTNTSKSSSGGFVAPEILELFTVNSATLPFFKPYRYHKGSALALADIRECLVDYINENELRSALRKGLIVMDPILSDLLLGKREYDEDMMWEDIITRVQSKMNPAYKVTIPGQPDVIKKGKLQPIVFSVEQRGGNKKVTLVHNLELFGIDAHEFGHRVQIAVACSTSVSERPGKNQGLEVLIQGNQIHYASNLLLDKYKIPRKYVQGLENAPKGKKKR